LAAEVSSDLRPDEELLYLGLSSPFLFLEAFLTVVAVEQLLPLLYIGSSNNILLFEVSPILFSHAVSAFDAVVALINPHQIVNFMSPHVFHLPFGGRYRDSLSRTDLSILRSVQP
jgi:hypothetical protein